VILRRKRKGRRKREGETVSRRRFEWFWFRCRGRDRILRCDGGVLSANLGPTCHPSFDLIRLIAKLAM